MIRLQRKDGWRWVTISQYDSRDAFEADLWKSYEERNNPNKRYRLRTT